MAQASLWMGAIAGSLLTLALHPVSATPETHSSIQTQPAEVNREAVWRSRWAAVRRSVLASVLSLIANLRHSPIDLNRSASIASVGLYRRNWFALCMAIARRTASVYAGIVQNSRQIVGLVCRKSDLRSGARSRQIARGEPQSSLSKSG
ncbi:MAG: hypothetical protein HC895_04640 [Leptolyngbyaceae cyanobacterium SM1_3_5]|nr:hypothetical protein [Leptolyngbyaceae cyanobacterium SM1_3_5]